MILAVGVAYFATFTYFATSLYLMSLKEAAVHLACDFDAGNPRFLFLCGGESWIHENPANPWVGESQVEDLSEL